MTIKELVRNHLEVKKSLFGGSQLIFKSKFYGYDIKYLHIKERSE
jgi:hypothetical protein